MPLCSTPVGNLLVPPPALLCVPHWQMVVEKTEQGAETPLLLLDFFFL